MTRPSERHLLWAVAALVVAVVAIVVLAVRR